MKALLFCIFRGSLPTCTDRHTYSNVVVLLVILLSLRGAEVNQTAMTALELLAQVGASSYHQFVFYSTSNYKCTCNSA
jgi:hypothetical protein